MRYSSYLTLCVLLLAATLGVSALGGGGAGGDDPGDDTVKVTLPIPGSFASKIVR